VLQKTNNKSSAVGQLPEKTTAAKIRKTIYHAWWRCQRAAKRNNTKKKYNKKK